MAVYYESLLYPTFNTTLSNLDRKRELEDTEYPNLWAESGGRHKEIPLRMALDIMSVTI